MGGEDLPKHPDGIPDQIRNDQREDAGSDFTRIFFVVIPLEEGYTRQHKKHGDGKSGDGIGEKVGHSVIHHRNHTVAGDLRGKIRMNEKHKNAQQKGNKLFLFPKKCFVL